MVRMSICLSGEHRVEEGVNSIGEIRLIGIQFCREKEEQLKSKKRSFSGERLQVFMTSLANIVFVIPFSHVDAFWVHTFEEYYRTRTSHILDNVVAMMPRLPKMTFIWSDIAFLAYWWERASEASQTILRDLVACGRLEIVTGGWVMPDEATTSLYGLFTQLIEGHEWLYDNLQVIPETSWSLDPFGVSSTMPYLLAASGVRGGLLIQRIHFAWQRLFAHLGKSEVTWQQSWDYNCTEGMKLRIQHSCTYVLTDTCGPATRLCQLYDFAHNHDVQFENIRRKTEVLLGQYGRLGSLSQSNLLVVPLGGDFRFANSSEWARQYSNYKAIMDFANHNEDLYHARIKFATLKEFFSEVGVPDLKVRGDFFPYGDYDSTCSRKCTTKSVYWTGYYTTRPRLKLLSSAVGAKLRAVEILFTLGALSWCREGASGRPWTKEAQKKLIWARRAWSLFQHHDGITGTSTAKVMKQQTKQLRRAGQYLKETLEGIVSRFLNSLNVTTNSLPANCWSTPRPCRALLRKRKAGKCVKIVVYNPIELARNDLLVIIIPRKMGRVEILENGETLSHQISDKGSDKLVYFKATLPPLSLKILQLVEYEEEVKNSKGHQQPSSDDYFTISNNVVSLAFARGILMGLESKGCVSNISMRIGTYDVYPGDNGAYLFKPCPKITYLEPSNDTNVIKGPVFTESRTYFDCCTLMIRILNQDENPVIHVSVDYLLQMDDKELFLEISTEINSVRWMTDMNDFQLKERIQAEQEGLQANIYPMTSISYVESDEERLVVVSDHSHGVANPRQGVLQVMLDRRTTEDDGKGMGEPLRDNTRTISKFLVVLYRYPNLTIDILGLSRRFSNPPLVLTVRFEDIIDEKQYGIARNQRKDQCFPRDYLFPGDWDVPRAFMGLDLFHLSDFFRVPMIIRECNGSPKEPTKQSPRETTKPYSASYRETTKRSCECHRESKQPSSECPTETTKRICDCHCIETTKRSCECHRETTKRCSECHRETSERKSECPRETTKRSPECLGKASEQSSEFPIGTTKRSFNCLRETTKRSCECHKETPKRCSECPRETTKLSSQRPRETTKRSYECVRETTKRRPECPRDRTEPSCKRPGINGHKLSDETFLLLKGDIIEGTRLLTMRTRQLSGESAGWALLVLHNTANETVTPFSGMTTFLQLEVINIVETTLTGIEEIEQYAVLSDIVMPPHALKIFKIGRLKIRPDHLPHVCVKCGKARVANTTTPKLSSMDNHKQANLTPDSSRLSKTNPVEP